MQITRLEGQLAEAVANKASLTKQLADINAKIAALPKPDPVAPTNATPALPDHPITPNPAAVAPEEDSEEIKASIKEQSEVLKKAQDECAVLVDQINERTGQLEKVEAAVRELETKKKGWEDELGQLREGNQAFEAQMNRTRKELQAEEKKVEKLSRLEDEAEQAEQTLKGQVHTQSGLTGSTPRAD